MSTENAQCHSAESYVSKAETMSLRLQKTMLHRLLGWEVALETGVSCV